MQEESFLHEYMVDTEPHAAVVPLGERAARVSYDVCARVNALLKYSSCKIFLNGTRGVVGPARILEMVPDPTRAGYVVAKCSTIEQGTLDILVGNGVKLDFYLR